MVDKFNEALAALNGGSLSSFGYLKTANELLSNPINEVQGRELIIRALDARSRFQGYLSILRAMVRKAGLFPYLYSEFQDRTGEEDFVLEIYRAEHSRDFIYHSMQLKILNFLNEGRNVVLSAPTSMGKSAIVDSLIASGKYQRMVIVVPTIALIDETRRRIAKKFSAKYDVISHNSQVSRSRRPTIYILTQERVNDRDDINLIDLFVIDEFYKLAFKKDVEDSRTIALNICLSKLLLVSKQFYMIGPSIDEVRGLSRFRKNYVFVPATFNTVAVNVTEHNISANDRDEKLAALCQILRESRHPVPRQTIIYCKSPQMAADIASELIGAGLGAPFESDYTEWVSAHYSSYWAYSRAINFGIGIHHGALPRAVQQYTVDMFNDKKIHVLICTSTIIEGVNTNAETVVVFDNRNGATSIDRFTHNNIKGRAGRMSVHFVGNVHCLERIPEETIESKIVDIPLGLQDETSPLNLLAGIEKEHVQADMVEALSDYFSTSNVPIWILKKHATYKVGVLRQLMVFLETFSNYELREVCARRPNAAQIDLICESLKIVETRALQLCNLQSEGSDLKLKLSRYLFAESHQAYLDSIIAWVKERYDSDYERSAAIDRDLKIIRNIFGFAVPRTLSLLQDMINHICYERKSTITANFGYVRTKFENSHLPGHFSALEEMGIPIQTLEKIVNERRAEASLNVLVRFLRIKYSCLPGLTSLDRLFIRRALCG